MLRSQSIQKEQAETCSPGSYTGSKQHAAPGRGVALLPAMFTLLANNAPPYCVEHLPWPGLSLRTADGKLPPELAASRNLPPACQAVPCRSGGAVISCQRPSELHMRAGIARHNHIQPRHLNRSQSEPHVQGLPEWVLCL